MIVYAATIVGEVKVNLAPGHDQPAVVVDAASADRCKENGWSIGESVGNQETVIEGHAAPVVDTGTAFGSGVLNEGDVVQVRIAKCCDEKSDIGLDRAQRSTGVRYAVGIIGRGGEHSAVGGSAVAMCESEDIASP